MISLQRYFLDHDIFERHRIVSLFIENNTTVLDVGGEPEALIRFLPNCRVTVSNVTKSDIVADAISYNFGVGRYDFVTSIDVLEHIPAKSRQKFIDNLVKTASRKVVISAPLWTKQHNEYEKKALKWYKDMGYNSKYLEEHIKLGLPTIFEVKNLVKEYNYQIFFSGFLPLTSFYFHFFNYQFSNRRLNRVFYLFKQVANYLINLVSSFSKPSKTFSEGRVRFYLIIDKSLR